MQFHRPARIYPGYIFDLDGTMYLSDKLLPGAREVITRLRRAGSRIIFVSNNPTISRVDMAAKLTRLGIPTSIEEVINSSYVLVRFLQQFAPRARVFPIGEQALQHEMQQAGFTISENPAEIEFVIASFDRTFHYQKLQIAFDAIRAGARFIATNADRYCPVENGGEPDAAAVIAAIEACTSQKVEIVVGKPSTIMAETALAKLGIPPKDCLLCGDRLETDILMGKNAGVATVLVLSGATHLDQLKQAPFLPDFTIPRIDYLLPLESERST